MMALQNNMPDGYIERKGMIYDQIAEKGDVDEVNRLQKENRNLMEKIEVSEQEYNKVRKRLEFIMPVIERMESEDFRKQIFETRKEQLATATRMAKERNP